MTYYLRVLEGDMYEIFKKNASVNLCYFNISNFYSG